MILLDNRNLHEPVSPHDRRRFSPSFLSRFNGLAVPTDLEYADAAFLGRDPSVSVGLEFTAPVNLAESVVHSGRILEQIRRGRAVYSHYFLMVWGDTDCDADGHYCTRWYSREERRTILRPVVIREPNSGRTVAGPFLYQAVDNFLNSLSILCGVYVKKARDEAELVRQTMDLWHWFSKPMEDHTTRLDERFYVPTFMPSDIPLVRRVAKELPGVGTGRSHAVAKQFGSVYRMANADEADWLEVDGIGKTIAGRVVRAIRNGSHE